MLGSIRLSLELTAVRMRHARRLALPVRVDVEVLEILQVLEGAWDDVSNPKNRAQ